MATWPNRWRRNDTSRVELDPTTAPAALTQGELDALQEQVNTLEARVRRMQYVESRSVRRLFLLARNVAKVIHANNVTVGEPAGNDAVLFILSNDAGKWLEMLVYPFGEMFVLKDAHGVLSDMTFRLGNSDQGDLSRETLLMLNGFAEFASRDAAEESDGYWCGTANAELALVVIEDVAA